MNTSAQDFLASFARLPESTREQGYLFEKLTQQWLQYMPPHRDYYQEIFLWGEWARRQRIDQTDVGIDLVARTHDDEYCAIQCKFFAPDHRLQKSDIDSFFTASGKTYGGIGFSERKIVATTGKWSRHAEDALANQKIECTRVDFADELGNAEIDWEAVTAILPTYREQDDQTKRKPQPRQTGLPLSDQDIAIEIDFRALLDKILPGAQQQTAKTIRPHQTQALEDVTTGLHAAERGKLIMACGTGKTFTALKIAEKNCADGGNVLFLVPSLALLSQTLREWSADSGRPLRSFAVCSDVKVGRDAEDIRVHDLAIPATTDADKLAHKLRQPQPGRTNVVFATYHSIDVVATAQQHGAPAFDLIICDEAHRTTGVEDGGTKQSHFTKVHNNTYLRGKKRLYMTATPRIYSLSARQRAKDQDVEVFSMDDEQTYGKELHRLDFSTAVQRDLLSDYKVLILTVDEKQVSKAMQAQFAVNGELNLDDAIKIIGCWKGLGKQIANAQEGGIADAAPMRRAVAFTQTISASKKIADNFPRIIDEYIRQNPDRDDLRCEVVHVDGTQNALTRNRALQWLKTEPQENSCHILSNVRCLSEGVDVPALDAVMFLNPRKSQVDVVQSVGRVMRKAEGKDYGYIILPIGVAAGTPPEQALNDNEKYRVVWDVLQALRAHDDRFNAEINRIDLNDGPSDRIQIIGVDIGDPDAARDRTPATLPLLTDIDEWVGAIYAKMVLKCGERRYWETWAKDVADIAVRTGTRIKTLVESSESNYRELFQEFVTELQQNLNPAVSEEDAVEMLAQHMITRPVFNALFANNEFIAKNPVSRTMQDMLELLDAQNLSSESKELSGFYDSVRQRAEGIDNAAGRQKIITELYDKFFRTAFPKMAENLGIVYTPVEVVDFIIHSVEHLLQKEFGKGLGAKDVHILDPFTGTGTFVTRLLQSDVINDVDLPRKYSKEIHTNEIVLLAYYIAAINIEQAYRHRRGGDEYCEFEGIALTDTFQINERDGDILNKIFPVNSARVQRQKRTPIRVVFGNPPYSAKQKRENDANKNMKYAKLDDSISTTYAEHSTATNKNILYDSYIRAIRWASDRIGDEGIVAFVTNGGYIDGTAMNGLRKCLYEEFSGIYCFNLRGNARTSGEQRRKERGNIFGEGTKTPVAILLLIKKHKNPSVCTLNYHDIGGYLSREQKLNTISQFNSVENIPWQTITPDKTHDWINQRNTMFEDYLPMGAKENKQKNTATIQTIFTQYALGVATGRDSWVYNFSKEKVSLNIEKMIAFYNKEARRYKNSQLGKSVDVNKFIEYDPRKISWDRGLKNDMCKYKSGEFSRQKIRTSIYRPFTYQWFYFCPQFNNMVYRQPSFFPTADNQNLAICVSGLRGSKRFSAFLLNVIPDLNLLDAGTQCFPRYTYEKAASKNTSLLNETDEYPRIDNIPQPTVALFQQHYKDNKITGDNIFYYVYGILHNETYKTKYAADLKKTLPRIPYAKTAADFHAYATAGKQLADLHIHYETADPYPLLVHEQNADPSNPNYYKVKKMTYSGGARTPDKSKIKYNDNITLENIPPEAHDYIVNGKSALDWIIERYQIKTDKDSKITNNPNDWSDNPHYILDLIRKVVTVSVETVKIVKQLPELF